MKKLRGWHISLIVIMVLGLGGGGFYYFHNISDNTANTPVGQQVAVAYGNVSNSVSASGSLVFPTKKTLTFGNSGTIGEINVKANDSVKAGQVLAKLDNNSMTSMQQAVTQAKISLQTAQNNLTKAQTPTYTQSDIDTAQLSIINSQIALKSAEDDLTKTQKNPYTQTDINQAQLAIINAQVALQNAQNDVTKLQNPSSADIGQAQTAVINAQIALQNAQNDLTKFKNPYSSGDIKQAELAVINARIAWQNAQADLLKAQTPYTQADIAQAQLTLMTNQTALKSAQDALDKAQADWLASPLYYWDPTSQGSLNLTQKQYQLTIARANLATAQANLDKMLAGPDSLTISQKQQQLEIAQNTLSTASDNLAKMMNPTIDPLTLQQKQQQVVNTQASLVTAQDNLTKILNPDPPDPLVLQQKQQQVVNTQASLATAQDNLTKILNPAAADPLVITQKQQQIVIAQNNLIKSQQNLDNIKNAAVDSSTVDLRKIDVANAQSTLDKATTRLTINTIKAPFDGVITTISLDVGANVTDNTAVFQITDPNTINVSAVLNEIDVAQVRVGQAAAITLDAYSGRIFQGKVSVISSTAARQSGVVSYTTTTTLTVPPGVNLLEGMSVNVDIVYQQAEHVLLIPVKAVSGSLFNPLVKVLVNGEVQEKQVRLGITDGISYQVLDGLQEGDIVMLPVPVTTTKANTKTTTTSTGSTLQIPGLSGGVTTAIMPGGGSGVIITGQPGAGFTVTKTPGGGSNFPAPMNVKVIRTGDSDDRT